MGDDVWFVRVATRTSYNLTPCRWQGWAVTAAYIVVVLCLTPLVERGQMFAWVALLLLATFAFLLVAWRRSAPAPKKEG